MRPNWEDELFHSMKKWLARHVPTYFLGAKDFYLHPEWRDSLGGPFNGQHFRQMIFIDLLRVCRFDVIAETGTYYGSTTRFLGMNSGGTPVYTSEIDKRIYEYARRGLRAFPNVHIFNLDSREFLSTMDLSGKRCGFFYLDAHWGEDLPLAGEIELITQKSSSFVIMIDDFQVSNDSGYGYDDYGVGKRLSLRDFPFDSDRRFVSYFPARHSTEESGRQRGCIVLASPDLKGKVDLLHCLVPIGGGH